MRSFQNKICSYYKGRSILLTGGSGYIASGILRILSNVECTITRLMRTEHFNITVNSVACIKDVYGDITDKNIWNDLLNGVDVVFHLAAQTSVYAANHDPVTDAAINVFPIIHLLEACRLRNLQPTIILAGTVTESGIPVDLPVNEMHQDNPVTIYDLHKLMAEQYVEYYARCCEVKGAVLRLSNVYGPGPISRGDRGVLNAMVRKALSGEILSIYGHGKLLRDYVYIEDVSEAFLAAGACIDHLR
jgi:nucleoside-diphosphate-sugar epimerase